MPSATQPKTAPALALPSEKTHRTITPTNAKVVLYGQPKVGKSSLCAALDPDHCLFLATETGLGGLEVYAQNIGSWTEFREAGALLAQGDHDFRLIVIDTVDNLYQFCMDQKMQDLGITHPSELEYGKGWAAVTDEFKLRIAKLASLGYGIWFISHAREMEVKTRIGVKTRYAPTLGGKARDFLIGFCDMVLYAEVIDHEDDNSQRVLRTRPTELYEAGSRIELPDPISLDAAALSAAMEAAFR